MRRVVRVWRSSCETVSCEPTLMNSTRRWRSSSTTSARSEEKASEKAAWMASVLWASGRPTTDEAVRNWREREGRGR